MAENNLIQTQSKGGIKYDLVLESPSSDTPPKIRPLQSPVRLLSAEDIENKLKVAEERRKSYEAQKINQAKERSSHVLELRDKRIEEEVVKIETTRQSLEKKMEASKENRESLIKAIQEKQKEHVNRVEAKRKLSLENLLPTAEKLNNFHSKMALAAESREAKIAALQERLRDHDRHVADVRKQMEATQQSIDLKNKLESKLKHAQENRDLIVKEIQERQKEHKRHINRVNENHKEGLFAQESCCCSRSCHVSQRIANANEKRKLFLKTRQERIKNGSKVAEVVKRKVVNNPAGDSLE